ncbi:hypothetical protein GQ457_02G000200 [Hibiscus cannabinus]
MSFNSSINKTEIWHARLGHAGLSKMQKIDFPCTLQSDSVHQCTVCPLAKQPRLSFPLSTSKTSNPFDLLHLDLWGPYRVPTHQGQRFFLTIVDDNTRMTWIFLLRLKSDAVLYIKQFFAYVQNHFSVTVKYIRSDNGTEFFNSSCSEFFSTLGVIHQSSCVSTPQQNGIAERKHRHLLEVARALYFQSKVPTKFWGECVKTACYLINRLPSAVLDWKSPFECLHHHKPDLSHLRVFGCLCYATSSTKDKFSSRAISSVFMGYSSIQKGYILFNLQTKSFFVNRDVIFHETVFPFSFPQDPVHSFFPPCTSIDDDFLNLSSSSLPTLISTESPQVSSIHPEPESDQVHDHDSVTHDLDHDSTDFVLPQSEYEPEPVPNSQPEPVGSVILVPVPNSQPETVGSVIPVGSHLPNSEPLLRRTSFRHGF